MSDKTALQEIDRIVGNETHLGPDQCSQLRLILFAALAEQPTDETDGSGDYKGVPQ